MITKSKTVFSMVVCACAMVVAQTSANAATQKSAHVSQVIQDVKLLPSNASPRPASVNDTVDESTAVRTGIQSRAELTFADFTITRLGANTVFTLGKGARELNLSSGSVLVQVPPKGAPVRINTAAVTAAISGGTAMFAVGPPIKFMVLEGTGTFYPKGHPEQAVTLHGGEMVMMTPDGQVSGIITFDVKTVLESSHLILDFPELANLPLILDVVNQQIQQQAGAGPPGPPPSQDPILNVIDVVSQNVTANPSVQAFTATPSPPPTPGPPVIASPVPYVINSGTVIATAAPTITTNGVTRQGVIYPGLAIAGPLSAFLFGSTSAFDTASGFDTEISGGGGNGLGGTGTGAVFKFTSLELAGDPTIDTTNGQINLGLVGVNGITSGTPGGVLTFAGIRGLLLATQDGPVTLGPEISFSGLHDLNIYARGASSDLTLASNIDTTSHVDLFAERDMSVSSNITAPHRFYAVAGRDMQLGSTTIQAETLTLTAFHDLSWNGETSDETANNSDGDVLISANNNINIAGDLNFTRHSAANSSGLNLELNAGADLTVQGSLTLSVDNSIGGSSIDTGGNIALNTGGNLTVNGANGITLTVTNTGETINNGGNINLMVGATTTIPMVVASATTGAVELFVDSSGLGTIGTGGNVTFQTVGAVMLDGALGMEVDSYNGGTINNGANITAHFGGDFTITAGQFHSLNFFLVNGSAQFGELGGTIGTGGNINLTFNGNIQTNGTSANGAVATSIFNDSGSITTGGNISVSVAGNLSAGNVLQGFISNDQGTIGTGGNITFHVAGDVTEAGHTLFQLFNEGGTINSSPTIDFSAHSLAVNGGTSITEIDNSNGGNIHGNATINFGLQGDFTTGSDATFLIDNSNGGVIGGTATINMNIAGSANLTNGANATVEILGSDGVANGAAINFNGGSYNVAGTFLAETDGSGTITFNNASVSADIVKIGALGTNGTLTIGSGPLSATTLLKLYAPGSNGTLNFVSNVTLSSGTAMDLAANTITIQPSVLVTIAGTGGAANIYTNNANYSGFGGTNPSNGTFGGNGANQPQPLANAPSFSDPPASSSSGTASAGAQTLSSANVSSAVTSRAKSGGLAAVSVKNTGATINLGNSGQLLSLLDSAVPGPSGKITIPASKSTTNSGTSNRSNVGAPLKADGGAALNGARVRERAESRQPLVSARSVSL